MNRERTYAWRAVQIFCGIFAATLGFLWLLIEVYTYFRLTWLPTFATGTLHVTIMLCLSTIVALCFVVGHLIPRVTVPPSSPSFDQSLIQALDMELKARNYADVIRIGVALTRPLFEEGKFTTRLEIGKIIEEAAALSGRRDVQVVALIDAIGWSLVELGEFDEARRRIEHGITLTEETGQLSYRSKGERHLGVICRRNGNYDGAHTYYEKSMQTAESVTVQQERDELIAGLNYAFASLYFYRGDLAKSMEFVDKSIASFTQIKDEYRLNMSYVLKGDLQFRLNMNEKARDTFRGVLQRADTNTEKLQVVRSSLGLAEVCISDHNWDGAQRSIDQIAAIDLDEFKAEAERLRAIRAKLPAVLIAKRP